MYRQPKPELKLTDDQAAKLLEIDRQLTKCHEKQHILAKEAGDLRNDEIEIRAAIMKENKVLSAHAWGYESSERLPLLYDSLGRFADYHAHIEIEDDVELHLCDNDVYLHFEGDDPAGTMKTFIKEWGITINPKHIQKRHDSYKQELEKAQLLLDEIAALTK
jgi:hypothetical protein